MARFPGTQWSAPFRTLTNRRCHNKSCRGKMQLCRCHRGQASWINRVEIPWALLDLSWSSNPSEADKLRYKYTTSYESRSKIEVGMLLVVNLDLRLSLSIWSTPQASFTFDESRGLKPAFSQCVRFDIATRTPLPDRLQTASTGIVSYFWPHRSRIGAITVSEYDVNRRMSSHIK